MAKAEEQGRDEQKGISRRQLLGKIAAAGAGIAAAGLLPGLAINSLEAPAAKVAGKGEGYALVADAKNLGKLIRWDKNGVAEAAGSTGSTGAAASVAGTARHNRSAYPYTVPDTHQWVMVVDLAKCDGCGQCQVGCNSYHNVPAGQEWVKVYQLKDNDSGAPYYFPRFCNQCDDPPCDKVCPVGATFKREDGIVFIDQDRCIGCRFCIAACPYSARYFNWTEPQQTAAEKAQPYDIQMNMPHRKGVAEKCLFCPEQLEQGKIPACGQSCIMGAIYFGDRNEDAVTNSAGETLKLSDVMKQGAYRALEELGTHPRVYYLPQRNRKYPGPKPDAVGKGV
ncbi:MAG: 4Fe-4S dicluster domain-containing protein [Symbiobacteriia bacterium]